MTLRELFKIAAMKLNANSREDNMVGTFIYMVYKDRGGRRVIDKRLESKDKVISEYIMALIKANKAGVQLNKVKELENKIFYVTKLAKVVRRHIIKAWEIASYTKVVLNNECKLAWFSTLECNDRAIEIRRNLPISKKKLGKEIEGVIEILNPLCNTKCVAQSIISYMDEVKVSI